MKNKLNRLLNRIHNCHICPNMDTEKRLRLINAVNFKSDVFIISQSLAENQLRKSGVNFFDKNGCLGNTGKNLEKFLNMFYRTVYPSNEIYLSDSIIPKHKTDYVSIYNTEIIQCYPGKTQKGDRLATKEELLNCIRQSFVLEEINLIKPKLILLMGRQSAVTFFKYILKEKFQYKFSDYIDLIIQTEIPEKIINNLKVYVLPIQHASGANPSFKKIFDSVLINKIKNILFC